MQWHSLKKEDVFQKLQTSEKGLTTKEFQLKQKEFGLNEISKQKKKSQILIFLKQFNSPLIYILFVAMIISFIFHHLIDAYVILAIVLINATIGFVQERKAEKAIDALKKLIFSYAKVLRNNDLTKVLAQELVPGDVILLEEGDKVPADAILLEVKNFRTQESSLTGESFPVDKKLGVLQEDVSIGDRRNMVFMGTLVVSGSAKAVVVSTANQTEIGKVAESLQEVIQPKMHFQEKVSQLAIQMAIFASIGAGLTFIVGYFIRGLDFFEIFLFTIASLVSGIPEGLPAVLIIVLAIGANRMAKRNAIIRHLPAVETLGVATIIATDKTGTITSNSMSVEEIMTADGNFRVTGRGWNPVGEFFQNKTKINPLKFSSLNKLLNISALCNKGKLLKKPSGYEIIGDPTEVALLVLSKKAGLEREKLQEKIIDDFPFNSELKLRATLVKAGHQKQIYALGAFENIIHKSAYILKDNKRIKLDDKTTLELLKKAEELAKKGLRVLALSYRLMPSSTSNFSKDDLNNLVFVGLVGMKDPPRESVKESIQKAKNAGIRIIMKTGDHRATALAIAKEIGLADSNSKVLTQTELEKMSHAQFQSAVKTVDIFARVSPKMKMKIIQALQEQGHIVAMTGDGVNDAPALKKADIGISMGIIGTDVARESSEMVLIDDHFSTIVNAIEEGRTVFRNVKRTSFFLITTNVAEDVTIIASLAIGLPLPMIPIQLLYVNLVTDTFNGIALATEPSHVDVLNQPPRDKKERLLNKDIIGFLIIMAGCMAIGTIFLFTHFLPQGIGKARTVAFFSISMFQLFNVFNMRSIKSSVFKLGIASNKWVNYALALSFALMLAVVYIPWFAGIFQFIPINFLEIILIILVASSVFIAGEVYKLIRYRG